MKSNLEFIRTDTRHAGSILAEHLIKGIKQDKNVLWFISGGSSIPIAQEAARIIGDQASDRLHILLVDEKFKDKEQTVTNWSQVTQTDTFLSRVVPRILRPGQCLDDSLNSFRNGIESSLVWADYTVGQFGIGEGFHTGGIQSYSDAIDDKTLAVHYERGEFHHITITTKLISLLDLVFVNSFGESKKELVEHFSKSTASVSDEPTQALKSAKKLIVATDAIY